MAETGRRPRKFGVAGRAWKKKRTGFARCNSSLHHAITRVPLTALDVGARGGFTSDLQPIADAVNARAFEPDPEECERLNAIVALHGYPWRSLEYFPVALGGGGSALKLLNIYSRGGSSSLLHGDVALAERFGRADYFEKVGEVPVRTVGLDDAADLYALSDTAYIKLDVQGTELAVLQSAPKALGSTVLAVRCEVSFRSIYEEQPLFHEVDAYLRGYGFLPAAFLELHNWRTRSRRSLPRLSKGSYPYSKGQLAHGDVLYLRDPAFFWGKEGSDRLNQSLKGAGLALCYGMIDYAGDVLSYGPIRRDLRDHCSLDVDAELRKLSACMGWRYRAERIRGGIALMMGRGARS